MEVFGSPKEKQGLGTLFPLSQSGLPPCLFALNEAASEPPGQGPASPMSFLVARGRDVKQGLACYLRLGGFLSPSLSFFPLSACRRAASAQTNIRRNPSVMETTNATQIRIPLPQQGEVPFFDALQA